MPHKLAEARYAGAIDEKLGSATPSDDGFVVFFATRCSPTIPTMPLPRFSNVRRTEDADRDMP